MGQTTCILCEKRLKNHQRRPVNRQIAKYLRKTFLIESKCSDYICGKCSRPVYRVSQSSSLPSQTTIEIPCSQQTRSPPSVRLNISSATKSHAYCFICKKAGPKLVTVPTQLRNETFLKHNILITADSRCCPVHLNNNMDDFQPNVISEMRTNDHTYLSRTAILNLLDKIRQLALNYSSRGLTFDNINLYSDDDIVSLTGIGKEQFMDLYNNFIKPSMKSSPVRSSLTSLGLYLVKMKSGLSNKLLSTIFNISKSSVRRAIHSVRRLLITEFVTYNLGFSHVSREDVINKHTRTLAQRLLADRHDQAILVLDGTYIYITKSGNFQFQRRSYSIHKGRPLVKLMVIVTTTGYYMTVLGPYFADSKNNDASIIKHIVGNNVEEIKSWMQANDIFVVDRGFRDSATFLQDFDIKSEMPAFMSRGEKQMKCDDANASRLITKVRWVVEAANSRIKRWKYFDHILPTSQIPYIEDNVRIVCALCNKYLPPLNPTKDEDDDKLTASRMLDRLKNTNELQMFVEENHLERRSGRKWLNTRDLSSINFPTLNDTLLRILTLGTYQLKLSTSYVQEYIDNDCAVELFQESEGLLRVRLQSRHITSKSYHVWIKFDSDHVIAWYCKCRAGARTVGTCSHVAAVLWYIGTSKYSDTTTCGVTDWGQFMEDAAVPIQVDSSDSEGSIVEE